MNKIPAKKLNEMSLEELWQLFPIKLTPHDEKMKTYYSEMEERLKTLCGGRKIHRISHIGSTAIKGIWAKPIVDILIESEEENLQVLAELLEKDGFIIMSNSGERISLNFGYTETGFAEKVYHLHLRRSGDNDELYFRDYLNEFEKTAKEYEQLKLQLWKQYEFNHDAYTTAKTDFVTKYTLLAKKRYNHRYD